MNLERVEPREKSERDEAHLLSGSAGNPALAMVGSTDEELMSKSEKEDIRHSFRSPVKELRRSRASVFESQVGGEGTQADPVVEAVAAKRPGVSNCRVR